jgi:uracil-DNA glycosylase family 4
MGDLGLPKCFKCDRCGLSKTRRNLVGGDGNGNSKLVFLGEAPGDTEDREGVPFVGRSGKLLRKLISKNGIKDFYITNVVKCRPPNNRLPTTEEIATCKQILDIELESGRKVIVALGKTASEALIPNSTSRYHWVNKVHDVSRDVKMIGMIYHQEFVITTYHPSYALRQKGADVVINQAIVIAKDLLEGRRKG